MRWDDGTNEKLHGALHNRRPTRRMYVPTDTTAMNVALMRGSS